MKENKLARDIGKSVEEAVKIIEQYMARYPAVQRFYEKQIAAVQDIGYSFTVLGRRRFLPEIHSKSNNERWQAERQASNVPIQGSAADVAKMAMVLCDRAGMMDKYGAHMLLQVHDELMFEVPHETTAEALKEIQFLMEHPFPTDPPLPLAVSIGKGPNWLEAK